MESYLVAQLFTACTRGDLESVKRLIELGVSPLIRDNQGNALFHLCCSSVQCELDVLQYLIAVSNSVNYNYLVNNEQQTLLHLACHSGKLDFVKYLFNHQFGSFRSLDIYGHTPLYYACSSRHYNIVSFICNNVAVLSPDIIYQCVKISTWEIMVPLLKMISFKDFMDRVIQEQHIDLAKLVTKDNVIQWLDLKTPFLLHYFAGLCSNIVEYLVNELQLNINSLDNNHCTPLHIACIKDKNDIVKFLTSKQDCKVEVENKYGDRPLHLACEHGSVDLVKHLVEVAGCDINAKGQYERSCLHFAVFNFSHKWEIIKFLTSRPNCDVETEAKDGNRILHLACEHGNVDLVNHLVEVAGCDINAKGQYERSCLHFACSNQNSGTEIVQFLFSKQDWYVETEDKNNNRAIHLACEHGNVDLVKHLVEVAGCNINTKGQYEGSCLHFACSNQQSGTEIVKFLFSKQEWNIEGTDTNGYRPLYLACDLYKVDLVKYLVEVAGCDINAKDQYKSYYLHTAFWNEIDSNDGYDIVKFVSSKQECDVEVVDEHGDRILHLACEHSNVDLVKYLVEVAGCDTNAKGQYERSCLQFACSNRQSGTEIVQFLFSKQDWYVEAEDKNNNRAIHLACEHGNVDLVKHLVEVAGCNINAKGQYKRSCLHFACSNRQSGTEIVQFLFSKQDWYVEAEDKSNSRSIHLACKHGNVDLVKHLVEVAGCDINAKGQYERSCLQFACSNRQSGTEIVQFLFSKQDWYVETEDKNNSRSIHLACEYGNVDLVKHLVEVAGCDINAKGQYERSCLHFALFNFSHKWEIIKFLTSRPNCDVETEVKDGNRILHLTCEHGNVDLVKYLVEVAGCDINAKGQYERSCLHFACSNRQSGTEIVQFLFSKQDWYVETEDKNNNRAIHLACEHGNVDLVKYLVEVAGCDTNVKGQYERSCLQFACSNRQSGTEIVQFLFSKQDWYVEAEDKNNNRAIHLACEHGNVDLVKHLVEVAGCDINAKGQYERSCLHFALFNFSHKWEIIKFLTSRPNCDVETEAKDGNRILHLTCEHGNVDLVKYLVEVAGCDINAKGQYERSCLHFACSNRQSGTEIVQFLFSKQDWYVETEDKNNNRAIHLACEHGNVDLVKYLVEVAGSGTNVKGQYERSCLHFSCSNQQSGTEIVKFLFSKQEWNIEGTDTNGYRPLYLACDLYKVDLVKYLVEVAGCDVNAKHQYKSYYLHTAFWNEIDSNDGYDIVKFLSSKQECDVEVVDEDGDRILHLACQHSNVDLVKHLVEVAGCDINAKGQNERSCLHFACSNRKSGTEIVQFLFSKQDWYVEAEDKNNDRAIHLACQHGNVDLVKHLVEVAGCDTNAKGQYERSCLQFACSNRQSGTEIVQFLFSKQDWYVETEDKNNSRSIHLACKHGNVDLVKHLVEVAGCDINAKGQYERSCLHFALFNFSHKWEIIKFLTSRPNCDVETEAKDGNRILHLTREHGNVDLVKYLVEVAGCDINAKGQYERSCLHFACSNRQSGTEIVQFLFSKQDWYVETEDKNNNRAIHLACEHGNVDLVKHLVDVAGCDINAKGQYERSCLHFSCLNQHSGTEIVQFLFSKQDWYVETEDKNNNRAIHLACEHGNVDLVKYLVEVAGCNINAKGQYERSCLHFACSNQQSGTEIVKFLFSKQEWNIEGTDTNGYRPLYLACDLYKVDLVKYLVEVAGCDVNAKHQYESYYLHTAFWNEIDSNDGYDIVKFLSSKQECDVEVVDEDGDRILHLACQHSNVDLVKHLVEVAGCDINAKGQNERSCLHFACSNRKSGTEIVQFLFSKQDWYVEAEDKNNDRAIHLACQHGNVDLVKHLVEVAGCDINAKGQYERSCLHFAFFNFSRKWDIIKFLTSRPNCDIEAEVKDGNRILHLACEHGSVDLVKHLVEVAGCDINAKGQYERSCLHFALFNFSHKWEIIKFLTSRPNCDVETEVKDGNRILHLTCEHGNVDLVKHLVEVAGCDINAKGQNERSCLHFACSNRKSGTEIVQFLFSKQDWYVEAEDKNNDRAIHLACQHGNVDLVKHLVEVAGCDINAKGQYERSCLHFAFFNFSRKWEIIKFLTSRPNCDIEAEVKDGNRILHLACEHGSVDLVKHLVEVAGCDINARGKNGKTCLHLACERNEYVIVKLIISQPRCDLEVKDDNFNKPFIISWYNENVDICRHLLCEIASKQRSGNALIDFLEIVNVVATQSYSDVQSKDDNSYSQLLLLASLYGNVELFSEINCDVNFKGHGGYTLLHCACASKTLCVKHLTSKLSCDVEVENDKHDRPLHIASCFGSVDITKHLVEVAGCDINSKGKHGYSPLHYACNKGHFEVAEYLIAQPSCNIEAEDDDHDRPIHLASRLGDTNILKHLINVGGCNVNAMGKNQRICLHWACEDNNFEAVKLITSLSTCNLESKDDDFIEPIQLALSNGNVDISKCLIKEIMKKKRSGNDLTDYLKIVNIVTSQSSTNIETESILSHQLLLLATLHGNVENIKSLLSRGDYDVNFKGHGSYTLLHCACASNNLACVEFLTAQINCDVEAQNDDHDRPLHIASCFGSVDITRHLVEVAGCDINSKGNHGYSPLHNACNRSHLEVVQFLTAQTHCNFEVEDDNHDRPLHIASRIGNIDIVMCLVNVAGCDMNVKGSNGYTSLHWACEKACFKMFCSLTTQLTCTANIPNDENDQPLHIAARTGSIDIVRHLVEKASCDVNAKGKSGYTPLHYACKHSSIEVMEYLLDHPDCDTDVLSSLSDYGDKRVQTVINFHNKFQLAMKSTGVAYLRVVKCILTGPPGAGKSTLKKRLLNESLIEPSLSTGVVDAGVLVDSFRKLQQQGGMVPCLQNVTEWNKQNVDEEAVFILESVSSNTVGQHQVKPIRRKKYKTSSNQMTSLLTAFVSASHENLDSRLTDQLADDENTVDWETLISADIEGKELHQVQETVENSKDDNSKAKAVKVLSETVQTIPVTEREKYEEKSRQISQDNHAMLHIVDTGGQPEFHEILPALITGPAINLLVFKLTEDLRSRYHITYRSSTDESQPYETSLTHEEVIFRSLASIACLRQNTIGWSFNESPIDDDSEPAAFLIATHRDQVDNSKVVEVNKQLKAKIQKSKLFHENLVQFASSDQLIHAIDTTYDILEIDELRNMLHKVISSKFQELSIPVSWCTFSVRLRKINKSLHNIDSCYKLALECGITDKEDFMFALWFLHHRVGSIMHYPEVNGLKDIVITDLQLVFDRITHLITSCFTFKMSGNAALENEFRTTGQFTEENIRKLSSKSDDPLSPVILVSLLRHLHIVAGPIVIENGPKYYFMPCALKPAAIEEEQRDEHVCPAPLLIYFECGYCPVGVFCCLVVHLLSTRQSSEMNWNLDDTPHFRNKITFTIDKCYHQITLICRATYLEVWPNPTICVGPIVPFYEIYQTLDKAIKTVTQSLHYMYKSHHFFGFPCTTCQCSPPHPAICEYDDPVAAKCVQGGGYIRLEMKHMIWFDEVWLY